mgnify:CR=1 FL=1
MPQKLVHYAELLDQIKQRIRQGQTRAIRLSHDLRNELPEVKGFPERNIGYMIRFAREYGTPPILQQLVAKIQPVENQAFLKVPQPVAQISDDGAQSIVQRLVAQIPCGSQHPAYGKR